jgi:DNA-binding XRE family transcriptional regulator
MDVKFNVSSVVSMALQTPIPNGARVISAATIDGTSGRVIQFLDTGRFAVLAGDGAVKMVDQTAIKKAMAEGLDGFFDDGAELATLVKSWRRNGRLTTTAAADLLGMSSRTVEGIEQGRGFRYSRLLTLAILAFHDPDQNA